MIEEFWSWMIGDCVFGGSKQSNQNLYRCNKKANNQSHYTVQVTKEKDCSWIGVEMRGDVGRPKKNVKTQNKPRCCPSPDDSINISDATASQQAAQAKHGFQGPEKNSNVVI